MAVDEGGRGLGDPAERGHNVQARADVDHRLEKREYLIPGGKHGLQPCLQFTEQLIKVKLWDKLGIVPAARAHQQVPLLVTVLPTVGGLRLDGQGQMDGYGHMVGQGGLTVSERWCSFRLNDG